MYRLFAVFLLLQSASLLAADHSIDALPPGHWYEVRNSRLAAVAPTPVPPGSNGVASVMDAWSGGAYDSKRDRLIVWGGGHGNYSGNEIYVFQLSTFTWKRLTDPSSNVGGDESGGYYPDGRPRSRHSYNFIEYIPPPIDRFCSFGAGGTYPTSSVSVPNVDCFDFDTLRWERKSDAPKAGTYTRIGSLAVYDAASGKVFLQTGLRGTLSSYDPKADTWRLEDEDSFMEHEVTAAVDPERRTMVAIGGGRQYVLDLKRAWTGFRALDAAGDSAIVKAQNPGLAFDPIGKQFVAWAGGAEVYVLDPGSAHWKKVPARNRVSPGPQAEAGTYGRFRYVPSKDLFILVNRVDGNVFFYKLPRATGARTP